MIVSPKRLKQFEAWLVERGAQIMAKTNEWEVLRYSTDKGIAVVYKNSAGRHTLTGKAGDAWLAFVNNDGGWRAGAKVARKKNRADVTTIRERDGDLCFYCQREVFHADASVEHLVAVTHGGPNHISNKFLAHKACNQRVGHISAPEKVAIHVQAILDRIKTEGEPASQS